VRSNIVAALGMTIERMPKVSLADDYNVVKAFPAQ
jgi:hypothetical protein